MGNATVSEIVNTATLVTYSVIFILGMLGNGLVIYVTGFRMKRTVNSVWFLNLALADFLFTTFMIIQIITVSQNGRWLFGWLMCKLTTFVNVINLFASIFLLAAISLDRCLSVCVVVWAQNKRTVRKAQLSCCVIWLVATVCSTPYATHRDLRSYRGVTFCSVSEYYKDRHYTFMIFRFVVGFVIPFLVIFSSYLAIGVRAGRLQRTRKRRSRRLIFAVVLAFFICWLPFHVMQFVQSSGYEGSRIARNIGEKLSVSLAYLNSCLNPILYVFMCDEFQKKLKQSICLVLESALAEDHLTFMSSRSLSSQLSRISRKSDATSPSEGKSLASGFKFAESKVVSLDEEDTDHS